MALAPTPTTRSSPPEPGRGPVSEPLSHAAALRVLGRIDRALPFTSIVTQGSDATV